jgi:hypothetical protein
VPVISGLLDGKSKVANIDVEKTGVKLPSDDDIKKAIGKSALKAGVLPATDSKAFASMTTSATPAATKSS